MAETDATIARVAVKIPDFISSDPELWFVMVEGSFTSAGVTADSTKFMLILKISQLTLSINQEIATLRSEVAAINTRPSRNPDSRLSTYRSRSRSRSRTLHGADGLCWYHWRYGSQSRKCKEPCTYNLGNLTGYH
jgi:hypothetical protein